MSTIELQSVTEAIEIAWQNVLQCQFNGCGQTLARHDGPDFECSDADCFCTRFVPPGVYQRDRRTLRIS